MAAEDWLDVAQTAIRDHGAIQKTRELAGLLDVIAGIRPQRIVEIGCDEGGTLYAWSQLPGPPLVVGVDLPTGPYRNASGLPEGHGAKIIIGDSHRKETLRRASEALDGELADVLFIDGDHSYKGVKTDFLGWLPIVRPGGLVCFHDIVIHEKFAIGVNQLWEEIRDYWPCMEITSDPEDRWGGIGIVLNEPLPAPEPILVAAR